MSRGTHSQKKVGVERLQSFIEAVEELARRHERQLILKGLIEIERDENGADWGAGFDAGVGAAIGVINKRVRVQ